MKGLGLMLAATLLLSACSQTQLPRPPESNSGVNGLWRGRVQDNIGGSDVTLTLIESDGQVEGELLLVFRFGFSVTEVRGSVSGTIIDENRVSLLLTPEDRRYCPYEAAAIHEGDHLHGDYEGVGCQAPIRGTLNLRRQ